MAISNRDRGIGDAQDRAQRVVFGAVPQRNQLVGRAWIQFRLTQPLLDVFFDRKPAPQRAAEVEDSALAKTLAREGRGLLLAPAVLAPTLRKHYLLRKVGDLPDLSIPYFAGTVARRIENPLISKVLERARNLLQD